MKPPQFISQQEEWDRVSKRLAAGTELAIDTEANSMYAYRSRICLVQIASGDTIYLLDPLSVRDLSALGPILANPAITKIMHGADYDLRCFHREYGFEVNGLFDTEICARFSGMLSPNLAAVLQTYLEVDIPKSRRLQRSNWGLRPLSEEAISYAAADVQHLVPLAARFREVLKSTRRLDWVGEEFGRMEQAARSAPEPAGPAFLRVKGSDRLTPQQLAVLKELFDLREAEAERVDLPPYRVMGNDALILLSQHPFTPLEDVPGLAPQLARRSGAAIRAAIRKGQQAPEIQRPARPRRGLPFGRQVQARLQMLKQWRSEKGVSLGLDPAHIWPATSLERLAQAPASWDEELTANGKGDIRAWQRREFAGDLEEALALAAERYPGT